MQKKCQRSRQYVKVRGKIGVLDLTNAWMMHDDLKRQRKPGRIKRQYKGQNNLPTYFDKKGNIR
jgi:hypothetical protein